MESIPSSAVTLTYISFLAFITIKSLPFAPATIRDHPLYQSPK